MIYRWLAASLNAGVAKLGQRRWDEVPVLNGSQVRILPPAPKLSRQDRTSAILIGLAENLPPKPYSSRDMND